jgi:hypothetical protein
LPPEVDAFGPSRAKRRQVAIGLTAPEYALHATRRPGGRSALPAHLELLPLRHADMVDWTCSCRPLRGQRCRTGGYADLRRTRPAHRRPRPGSACK